MQENDNTIKLQQLLTPEQQKHLEELEQLFTYHTIWIASFFKVPRELVEREPAHPTERS